MKWIIDLNTRLKLSLLIIPPLLICLIYGGMFVHNKYEIQTELNTVLSLSELAVINSALVHELQKERGMSAGFLGSKGQSFAQDLPQQRSMTDQQVSNFSSIPAADHFPAKISSTLRQIDSQLQQLQSIRRSVDNLSISVAEEVKYYSDLNKTLLSVVDETAMQSTISELSLKLASFGAFLQLKERAGIERAVLSSTFGQQGFKAGGYAKFVTLVAEQNTYAERFSTMATDLALTRFEQDNRSKEVNAVNAIRQIAFSQNAEEIKNQHPEVWFKTSTNRINLLAKFEQYLATELVTLTQHKLSTASQQMWSSLIALTVSVLLLVWLSLSVSRYLSRSLNQLFNKVSHAGNNFDLSTRIDHDSTDEFGELAKAFNGMMADFETVITQVRHNASQLVNVVEQVNSYASSMRQDIEQGHLEAEQVASAMTEMSATVTQIAANAVQASDASSSANKEANIGNIGVSKTAVSIKHLAGEINDASTAIKTLDQDVQSIASILEVISAISEQTNLLALNAAIEAARAGEQGRGFAVVADEVRTLAQRTQSSTDDIKRMTERLKSGAQLAVQTMERGMVSADESVIEVEQAGNELQQIVAEIDTIDSMNQQIASATHEQAAVAEEVNRNAMQISEIYSQTQNVATALSQLNETLLEDAAAMSEQVQKFTLS
ncbi:MULTISPECIES: methyl-accepting chemotaxis protein [unclassified Shewanella]|uniref:methyl-accepting chemotaxis protein n=1 Tax=unclassified Shewanella TaxID=196818 RepID=UPI000C82CBA1|nr:MULTISPECIES: methyl-accepting chemotaxis protein [unclassified Shewanella]MDO6680020.1 methyl-accepting chemotaxis protein [Shewanella sp. 4_MG-2023]PMI03422.1 chemotaxis protein [Shewanella sp. 10N.286.48.A6]